MIHKPNLASDIEVHNLRTALADARGGALLCLDNFDLPAMVRDVLEDIVADADEVLELRAPAGDTP